MSKLLTLRKQRNLTQTELAEKAGVSVRTIQRIESGVEPKGHTLKAIAQALDIAPFALLDSNPPEEKLDLSLIKGINLSCILFFVPLANIAAPLLLAHYKKIKHPLVNQIVSLQVLWTLISAVLFLLSPFIKRWFSLPNHFVVVVLFACLLVNLIIIIRNAISLDQSQTLAIKLNFNIL